MDSVAKPTVIYQNIPYKKFRWIVWFSLAQSCIIGTSLCIKLSGVDAEKKKRVERSQQFSKISYNEQESDKKSENSEPSLLSQIINEKKSLIDLGKAKISFTNAKDNFIYKPFSSMAILCAGISCIVPFLYYARRSIHRITLLPNDRVLLEYFSPLALSKPKSLELPLKYVSCKVTRKSSGNYVILKLKDHVGYHLVHKSLGSFSEPKLFDMFMSHERVW